MAANVDNQVEGRKGTITKPGRIAYFEAGSTDTLLSSERANQLVAAYNKLANLTVGPGLRITWSDTGPVISLDENGV